MYTYYVKFNSNLPPYGTFKKYFSPPKLDTNTIKPVLRFVIRRDANTVQI